MAEKLTIFDPTEGLTSDEAIAAFMAEAFASEDAGSIAHALGVVARAKGNTQIGNETGLSREQLYRSFSEYVRPAGDNWPCSSPRLPVRCVPSS